jgi:hypothetical protein
MTNPRRVLNPARVKQNLIGKRVNFAGFYTLIFDANFSQNIFQQTPFGNGGLEQIGTNKSGKPQPVLIDINCQQETD